VQLGIIHRDLKPANILIKNQQFKIAGLLQPFLSHLDFGFAKCLENFNQDMLRTGCGTPLYMSP
jgi:serine/threonine protein kinase